MEFLSLRDFVSEISLSLLLYPREFHALAYNFSMWIFVGFGYVVYSVLDLGHSRCVLVSLGLD